MSDVQLTYGVRSDDDIDSMDEDVGEDMVGIIIFDSVLGGGVGNDGESKWISKSPLYLI